jgi:hypothetical protein
MKKFLLLFLLHFTALFVHAQISVGLRGGYNVSAMKFESASGQKSGGLCSGSQLKNLQADLVINIPVYGGLYIQPLFRYITKGTSFESAGHQQNGFSNGEAGNRIQVHYIEMPFNLLYKFQLPGFKLAVGGGPYAAYGLNGVYKADVLQNGSIVSHNNRALSFDHTDNVVTPGMYLNRWDAGINTTVGFELNNLIMIGLNYSIGMVDLDNSVDYKVKNSYAGISIGILFNREDY